MTAPDHARLLAALPEEARDLYQRAIALAAESTPEIVERRRLFEEVLTSVGYRSEAGPRDVFPLFPPAATLTPAQRAALELVRNAEPAVGRLGPTGSALRRYLGLDPPGEIEQPVGEGDSEPLWHAIARVVRTRMKTELPKAGAILNALPLGRRLIACAELVDGAPYGIEGDKIFDSGRVKLLDELGAEGRSFAPMAADALLVPAPSPNTRIRLLVFLALARAGVAIEPRWEILLPVGCTDTTAGKRLFFECLGAIAKERRAAALLAVCEKWPNQVRAPVDLLQKYPSVELLDVLSRTNDRARLLSACPKLVRAEPQLSAEAPRAVAESAPLVLRCARVTKIERLGDLGPVRVKQLIECGRRYDKKKLAAEVRLGPGDYDSTGSFRGHLELWEIADEQGRVRYDAWRCMTDSGTVFEAGTTTVVAEIVQFGAEAGDERLVEALDAALAKRPRSSAGRRLKTRA